MTSDTFVCFGQDTDVRESEDDAHDYVPLIEGDCTDETHFNWCELRGTGFELTSTHQEKSGDDNSQEETDHDLPPVTLKKRVDWASTQLFQKCCQAGKAEIARTKTEADIGTIKDVVVEVCKIAGQDKFPYIVIEYKNVRVVSYGIEMSDPEPVETIVFKYDAFRFGFQKTDPFTGLPVDGDVQWTTEIKSTKKSHDATRTPSATQSAGPAATPTGASGAAASTAGGSGSAGNNGSPPGLATPIDAAVSANFPGLLGATGFGVLPD
jgi:type VI protein secretion system component Hcp